jgi:hypothetical protein
MRGAEGAVRFFTAETRRRREGQSQNRRARRRQRALRGGWLVRGAEDAFHLSTAEGAGGNLVLAEFWR